ncbi:MAG: saccharopine dehydrogenase NADP-binding domain-containing protein [Acidobacteria bacterium]|nr:saccharopine dehydrogenase NADP-binding domain-containing protein [Acidobacteriota bacterium]
MRYIVLGAGLMGRAAFYDLARSQPSAQIVVADYDLDAAREAVRAFGRGRARAVWADVRKTREVAALLRGADVVLNCTQYYWNLDVMKAALPARVHYLDLGGLFHMTRKQLRLSAAFRRAGRLALIGMGGAPGITNVMARHLAGRLDRVEKIAVYNGTAELNPLPDPLAYTFSIATIFDELTLAPMALVGGRLRPQALFSGEEEVRFPPPLGRLKLWHSLHSELGTLPENFRRRGLREVCFKINYDPRLVATAKLLAGLGLLDSRPITVDGAAVVPRKLLEQLLKRRAVRKATTRDIEILRVVVTGTKGGRRKRVGLDAITRYSTRPSFTAVARDTGFPASIVAQMMARGEIEATGVRAPEEVVPPDRLFAELAKRGIRVQRA